MTKFSASQSSKLKRTQKLPVSRRCRPHDNHNIYVSLRHWRILHAVIDCGGFAEAGAYLHLSQSAVSHTVAKLQDQVGIRLLKIEGRKAYLTEAGKKLLDRSRHVLKEAIELQILAKELGKETQPEIVLAIDHHFPSEYLIRALHTFAQSSKGAQVNVIELPGHRDLDRLTKVSADLAISSCVPAGFVKEPLLEIEYIAVAHPDHPLLKSKRLISPADLAGHLQVGHSPQAVQRNHDATSSGVRSWNIDDVNLILEAVCDGIGYAWVPTYRARKMLGQGLLAALPIAGESSYRKILYLVHCRPASADSDARKLASVIRSSFSSISSTDRRNPALYALLKNNPDRHHVAVGEESTLMDRPVSCPVVQSIDPELISEDKIATAFELPLKFRMPQVT
ncbi:LysR family transcriptional regulator [Noviherbaspirillum saxi]|uniref:LysR family transcriptional regulator n=1 Tax=Noviherbaspirillum saxi TaxID=2320863 RepID=A0A3A3G398_9BURK|nr:LysR family transcriptional regulator [Noviherbaspirillum saxi]RJF95886.1 LysR family transcriptional regulator [Noviherbaspirillum saxi]